MKIAISGLNPDTHKELIKEVQKAWPLYVSPIQSIFDEEETETDDKLKSLIEEMKLNEDEADNFKKWYLLQQQYEKYADQKYIIYNGSPVDLLCEALLLADAGLVSDEYIEKIIYYHKKYLQKLDVVYWIPNVEGTEGLEDEVEKKLETIYNNLWNNYQTKFDSSPYFNQSRTAAYLRFETTEYLTEMRDLIDIKGNLYEDNVSNVSEEELKERLSKYPDLYQIYIEAKNANAQLIKK